MTTSETGEQTWRYEIQWSLMDHAMIATALMRKTPGFVDCRIELFDVEHDAWVPVPDTEDLYWDILKGDWHGFPVKPENAPQYIEQLRADHAAAVAARPAHWLATVDGGRILLRSFDGGKGLEGYAVSGDEWVPIPSENRAGLGDPSGWQPVAWDDLDEVGAELLQAWRERLQVIEAEDYAMFVDERQSDESVRRGIVHYIVETLKALPDGLRVGMKPPVGPRGGVSTGPGGPGGSHDLEAYYRVWGFPDGYQEQVLDAFKQLWQQWGWLKDEEDTGPAGRRSIYARTDDGYGFSLTYHREHGGVSLSCSSPHFPAANADPSAPIASLIAKDGPQSYQDVWAEA